MEIIRKRRASAEVEHLMTAVKSDYEFFASFDAIFETPLPTPKRQRRLTDALFEYTDRENDSITPSKTIHGDRNSWRDVCQTLSTEKSETKLAKPWPNLPSPPELRLISSQPPSGQTKSSSLSVKRIGSPTSFLRHHHHWHDEPGVKAQDILSPVSPPSVRSLPTYAQEIPSSKDNREHFEQIFDKITSQSQEIYVEIPEEAPRLGVPARRYTFDKDGIEQVLTPRQPSADEDTPTKLTTRITYGEPPSETWVYNTPPRFTRRTSVEESGKKKNTMLINREKRGESPMRKRSLEGSIQSPAPEEMLVEQTTKPSIQRQLTYSKASNQRQPLVGVDNHVDNSPTNEGDEVNLQELEQYPKLEDDHILPNYIITRVGSLLWLDKSMVYPISLEEIQRRVKDPENFSFQMLIAYVRHSRAKGRQFLDYWKCKPTGKAAKPNVLSKLCEADTKELMDGIQKVNEEYFPCEKLAQNAAKSVFKDRNTAGNGDNVAAGVPEELREKVERIEKSRSVFRTLEKTLSSSQNDEKFETFNIASHNAGLDNIKNNLRFLDGILEKMQIHIQGEHTNFASFIG